MTSALGRLDTPRPLLISGVYRSGTTILAQVLRAHPQLAVTYDSVKFPRFCLGQYDPVDAPENWRRLITDTATRLRVRWDMHFDVEACLAELEKADQVTYALAYDVLMRGLLARDGEHAGGGVRWGEKIAVSWTSIPAFLEMFPRGQAIHVFRDPRDATASYRKLTYEPGLTYMDCALNCLHAMSSVAGYQERFGSDRVMWVRMESLLEDPDREARRMCAFLGVDFDPRMIDSREFTDKAGKPWRHNSIFEPEMSGIHKESKRWEGYLPDDELRMIERITGPWMKRYGYVPATADDVWPSAEAMETFLADPWFGRWLKHWQETGEGHEGYRTDPIGVEWEAVRAALDKESAAP